MALEVDVIYNEDCLEEKGMKRLPDESIDLIITSPPYNLGGDFHTLVGGKRVSYGGYGQFDDKIPEEKYQNDQVKVINQCMRVLKVKGNMFYLHKNRLRDFSLISPYQWLFNANCLIRQEVVWDTTNEINQDRRRFISCHEKIFWLSKTITHLQNIRGLQDCWIFRNKLKRKVSKHPATFPIEIVLELLELLPNAKIILDPYMGIGTVAIACKQLNRNYIGFEISPEYCEIAKQGSKAEWL